MKRKTISITVFLLLMQLIYPDYRALDSGFRVFAEEFSIPANQQQYQFDKIPDHSPTPASDVWHDLPYPGMTTDNPFYPLKLVRDMILEAVVTSPDKRTELLVLQSEKYLSMSLSFFREREYEKAYKAAEISVRYLMRVCDAVDPIQESGGKIPDHVIERIIKSSAKQMDVITYMYERQEPPEPMWLLLITRMDDILGKCPDNDK